jgi:biuret amidohydrolase
MKKLYLTDREDRRMSHDAIAIDPTRSAVLLLHHQNEVVDAEGLIGRTGMAAAAAGAVDAAEDLAQRARAVGVPVLHVTFAARHGWTASTARNLRRGAVDGFAAGSWGAAPVARLTRPEDHVLTHDTMSAFAGTSLSALLRTLDRRRVLLAGVSTHLVVAASAFAATDLGYETVVVPEACAAPSASVHDAALAQLSVICEVAGAA